MEDAKKGAIDRYDYYSQQLLYFLGGMINISTEMKKHDLELFLVRETMDLEKIVKKIKTRLLKEM